MGYAVNIEGFEGQQIEVKMSFWTGAKLFLNGKPAPKGSKRGEMVLQRNDGKQVIATWNPQALGLDIPQLIVDGKTIILAKPLQWYQWIWGGWPVALLFVGGALGAIAGLIAFSINAQVFRSEMSNVVKYILTAAVSGIAVVAYFIAAVIFSSLING